jgi:hypothetical protein
MEGPARGFLNRVCRRRPLMANDAPDSKAVMHCGSLELRIIMLHEALGLSPPKRMFITSLAGMFTEP